ncbi:MAG: hypothetical protein HYV76_00075 [Candidatus Vogelbacteria bacterium]|nr:hypothetical protein [Candidatus Vogelbacteria bacterium]
MTKFNLQRGVTLVEMLIVSAFVIVILLLIVVLSTALYKAVPHYQVTRELARDSGNALNRLGYEVRGASAIVLGSSTLGATSSVLMLSGHLADDTAYTTTFKLDHGQLMIARDNAPFQALTSSQITVNSFMVYRLVTLHSEAVYVTLDVVASTTGLTLGRTFENTIILRGSYVE